MPSTFTFAPSTQYLIRIYCKDDNQVSVNTRVFQTYPDSDAILSEDGAEELANYFMAVYVPLLHGDARFRGVTVQPLAAGAPPFQRSTLFNDVGTGGDGGLPKQTCGVVTLNSTVAGRAGRGRIYAPFPPAARNDPTTQKPTAAYMTTLDTLGGALVGSQNMAVGAEFLHFDWILKPSPIAPGGPFNYLATYVSRQRWGTQRSRGDYGATNTDPWD